MRLRSILNYFGICMVIACSLRATAGAPFPCLKAAASNNGNFLVVSDLQIEPGPGNTGKVRQVTFQIFPKENFINAKDRTTSPSVFWGDWLQWSVVLDGGQKTNMQFTCPLPLISDDGEFLVLLRTGPTFGSDAAIRIYRRRDHTGDPVKEGPDHGVLIREIPINEIWPKEKLEESSSWNDHTPEWFAGGTFEFSSDFRQLIHTTRWGTIVHVDLPAGSVSLK